MRTRIRIISEYRREGLTNIHDVLEYYNIFLSEINIFKKKYKY